MDAATDRVRRFYERAPFPGYPPRDSLAALRARAERNPFARLLDLKTVQIFAFFQL